MPENFPQTVSRCGAPLSPHLRWAEVAGHCVVELLRLKQRAKLLARAHPDEPDDPSDKPNFFHGFERETLQTMGAIVCEGLGWNVTHNTDLPVANLSDRFVYIGNHPTLTATWPWGAFMEEHFGSNIVAVGKRSVIENPLSRWFLGDLMLTARKGIFIDRENRAEALQEIREHAASILTPGTGAVVFADEHRPYPRRVKRQQREWDLKRPDLQVGQWMTHTCFPKSGGLWEFAKAIEGLENVRFFDSTIIEPETVYRFGGKLHIDVREIPREELFGAPESEEHLRGKLVELWQRKNEMIQKGRE